MEECDNQVWLPTDSIALCNYHPTISSHHQRLPIIIIVFSHHVATIIFLLSSSNIILYYHFISFLYIIILYHPNVIVGILAAAGLQALDDFESGLLEEDHRKAKFLSEQLADLPGLLVNSNTVDTNIILVHLEYPASDPTSFAAKLKTQGK